MGYEKIITIEPGKRGGKPCIRGLRITVYDVLDYLASGMTEAQIIADFPDLRLRDVDTLKIDHFSVGLHAASNPGNPTSKWYDNLVAATEYIGPMAP